MGKKLRKKKKKKRNRKGNWNRKKNELTDHLTTHDDALESITQERDDSISSLPDEILCHIVSFLPFTSALRTIILSTRWRNLWITNFVDKKVDDKCKVRRGNIEDILSVIVEFESYGGLDLNRPPQMLQFHFSHGKIILATINGEKKLNLDFSIEQNGMTSGFGWYLGLPNRNSILHPTTNLPYSVKTLHLRSVSHLTGDIVSTLISSFHLLESLSIEECIGLNYLCLRIDADHRLQTLTVLDCPQLNRVNLFDNKLKLFQYRGFYPMLWITDVPSLTDVMLDVTNGPGNLLFSLENFLELRDALQDVEILTLCGWFFEVQFGYQNSVLVHVSIPWWLMPAEETFDRSVPRFNNLKELWWISTPMNRYRMDAVVSFLKICPNLERIFINIDPTCYCVPYEFSWWWTVGSEDYVKRKTPAERLDGLKIIKIAGFRNQEEEILLIDRLLKDVVGVESPIIIATSPENGTRRLVKIPQNQPKQRRMEHRKDPALGNQEIEYDYEFVKEESCVLRPKHASICL